MRLTVRLFSLSLAFASVVTVPHAAMAGPETWQGAMDGCLAPLERVEDATACVAEFIKVCVTEAAAEADPTAYCTAEETKAWEAKMAASLAGVASRAEGAGASAGVEAAQAAWIAARDADCALSAAMAGNDAAAADQICRLHAAMNRYIRLETLAQGGF